LRLHQLGGRDPGRKTFLGKEKPKCLVVITRRKTCMSEMNMGERFLPLVPQLRRRRIFART